VTVDGVAVDFAVDGASEVAIIVLLLLFSGGNAVSSKVIIGLCVHAHGGRWNWFCLFEEVGVNVRHCFSLSAYVLDASVTVGLSRCLGVICRSVVTLILSDMCWL